MAVGKNHLLAGWLAETGMTKPALAEAIRAVSSRLSGREVTVSLRGSGQFTDVSIDPESMRRYNARDLGDMVLEAVNDGLRKMAEATSARFAPVIEAAGRMERFTS